MTHKAVEEYSIVTSACDRLSTRAREFGRYLTSNWW